MSEYLKLLYTKYYSEFQSFIFTNNILVTASGFTIGIATHNLINENLKLLTPLLTILYDKLLLYNTLYFGLTKNSIFASFMYSILMFILNFISWIIIILFSFILLEYILNNKIFGLKSTLKQTDEKDFLISKVSAKKDDILPTNTDLKKIVLKEKTDEIIGDKIIKNKEINNIKESVKIIDNKHKDDNNLEYYNNFMLL